MSREPSNEYITLAAELEEANGMWQCQATEWDVDFHVGRLWHNGNEWCVSWNHYAEAADGALMLRVIEDILNVRVMCMGVYTPDNNNDLTCSGRVAY